MALMSETDFGRVTHLDLSKREGKGEPPSRDSSQSSLSKRLLESDSSESSEEEAAQEDVCRRSLRRYDLRLTTFFQRRKRSRVA